MSRTRASSSSFESATYRSLWRWLRAQLHANLDKALPELCAACRCVNSNALLCAHCSRSQARAGLQTCVTVGGRELPAFAPYSYTSCVREAVHRLKFEAHPELARRAARAIHDVLPPDFDTSAWWVPVPLEVGELAKRGYNQAALLANELAHSCAARSYPTLLQRNAGSAKQSQLLRAERLANLEQAFDLNVRARPLPVGSRIVLVDDVFTTGATARACCKVLCDCGYMVTAVVTLAQVVLDVKTPVVAD